MDNIHEGYQNSSNDPIYQVMIENQENDEYISTINCISYTIPGTSTRMEETRTNGHSEGNFVQELEEMDNQINKYTQFSEPIFSNKIFSEFRQEKDLEVDWSILPKFDHYDPDEEKLELGNQNGEMMTKKEMMTIIDNFLSLHPEDEQLKENDQALVRIGKDTKNKTGVDQILNNNWIKPLSIVEIQTKVASIQPTVGVSVSTSLLFYNYEDPFWRFDKKENFSQFLDNHGASQNGPLPAIHDKYLRILILINLHLNDIYQYYHPCFTLSVGKITGFSGK